MAVPIVHFEIRSENADATREFYSSLFGWKYAPGQFEGHTYVEEASMHGGIRPADGGNSMVTVYADVPDVQAALGDRPRRIRCAAGDGPAERHDRPFRRSSGQRPRCCHPATIASDGSVSPPTLPRELLPEMPSARWRQSVATLVQSPPGLRFLEAARSLRRWSDGPPD